MTDRRGKPYFKNLAATGVIGVILLFLEITRIKKKTFKNKPIRALVHK